MTSVRRARPPWAVMFLALTCSLSYSLPTWAQQPTPQPCGPGVTCNGCSQTTLDDLIEDEIDEALDRLEEFLRLDNLIGLGVDAATEEIFDLIEEELEDGGDPEQLELFNDNRSLLETTLGDEVEELLRTTLGVDAVDAIRQPTKAIPVTDNTDRLNFVGPDAPAFEVDGLSPIIDYDLPNLSEASELLDRLGDEGFDSIRDDVLQRTERVGLRLDASYGDEWRFSLEGGVNDPFSDDRFFGELDAKYDNGRGFQADLELMIEEGGEYTFTGGFTLHFSDCRCCVFSELPLADCNRNGIEDRRDVESGRSQDVNANGRPDECEVRRLTWVISGEADGGQVTVSVSTGFGPCSLDHVTTSGQSAGTVAGELAAVVNGDACFTAAGIVAEADRGVFSLRGFLLADLGLVSTDPGLEIVTPALAIPTLGEAGLFLLALVLLLAGLGLLRRVW